MDTKALRNEAFAVFDALVTEEGALYHILNARRENTAPDYDGDSFLSIFEETMDDDFSSFDRAVELFRSHSVPRK